MNLSYTCRGSENMEPSTWKGNIDILRTEKLIEANVTARSSSFHVIVGRHRYGCFICIPNWGVGTELSDLSDRFWNLGRLQNVYPGLSAVDAISIADALVELSLHYRI